MSNWVTFRKIPDARTGNCLFQYLACKLIQLLHGCEYKPIEECDGCDGADDVGGPVLVLNDETFYSQVILVEVGSLSDERGVLCHGYFQKGDWFCQYRDRLLDLLYSAASIEDYWIFEGRKVFIRDLLHSKHTCDFSGGASVVVVSLRLDDFIQWPCPTSDIVRPTFYTDILETIVFDKLYIVCDTIRHDWERAYIEHFQKWSPVLIQESLLHDCAVMRECPILLHSNSTLCWLMSFLGRVGGVGKKRFIPLTHFYPGQTLCAIDPVGDVVADVSRMDHAEVMSLRYMGHVEKCIYPLSYSLPDEMVVVGESVMECCKTRIWAEINPMDRSTYRFRCGQEAEYHQQYRDAMFAYTLKKGGWDCLRHYEIMVNGCIPVFVDLEHCPRDTLMSFPKELVAEANRLFGPLVEPKSSGDDLVDLVDRSVYLDYRKRVLEHVRNHCTVLANARYVLRTLGLHLCTFQTPTKSAEMSTKATLPCAFSMHKGLKKPIRNVLMIRCDVGVNYTREMFWIGMKRHIDSMGNDNDGGDGGCAVEYPAMPYLYSDFPEEQIGNIHGWGYGYARRLDASTRSLDYPDDASIMASICSHKWDLIVFGKTGPDEGYHGSIPNLPFWTEVFRHYSKDEIVFLYGGDECIDMTYGNHYRDHILKHAQYGSCFVRELRR